MLAVAQGDVEGVTCGLRQSSSGGLALMRKGGLNHVARSRSALASARSPFKQSNAPDKALDRDGQLSALGHRYSLIVGAPEASCLGLFRGAEVVFAIVRIDLRFLIKLITSHVVDALATVE